MIYFVIWSADGRTGIGQTQPEALAAAIGCKAKQEFDATLDYKTTPQWSAYITRQCKPIKSGQVLPPSEPRAQKSRTAPIQSKALMYECCSVSRKGIQIMEVFRSESPKAIEWLDDKFSPVVRLTQPKQIKKHAKRKSTNR